MLAKKNHILSTFLLVFALFFTACGYKPTAFYAKQELKKDVFVDLKVRVEDPQNSVLVKDSVTKILMQKIGSSMVDKSDLAEVIMNLSISSVSFSTLSYDRYGNNKLYKANVVIVVKYYDKSSKKTKNFTVDGEHDFAVDIAGTINDTHRFEAIAKASDMAVTEILSKIAVASFK